LSYTINLDDIKIKPRLWVAKPNQEPIGRLTEAKNIQLTLSFGKVHELSFVLPYKVEKRNQYIDNPNIEKVKERYLIKLKLGDLTEWFIIDEIDDEADDVSDFRPVHAYSLPHELSGFLIRNYLRESKTIVEVMNEVLSETLWSVGEVDDIFYNRYRTFQSDEQSVLEFIFNAAETVSAILEFDTENRLIHIRDEENISQFNGLKLSYGNLIRSISKKSTTDEMVTRLIPIGKDGLTINSVNPTGTDYIESFDFFMYPFQRDENKNTIQSSYYMSDALCHAILDYQELVESKKGEFSNLLTTKQALQTELTTLQNELMDLQTTLFIIQDRIDVQKANSDYQRYEFTVQNGQEIFNTFTTKSSNKYVIIGYFDSADGLTVKINNNIKTIQSGWQVIDKIDGNSVSEIDTVVSSTQTRNVIIEIVTITNDEYTTSDNETQILDTYSIDLQQGEVDAKQIEVDNKQSEIDNINDQINDLKNQLAIENNFTPELIRERKRYIIAKTWQSEYHIDAQELYDDAVKYFEEMKKPKAIFNVDIINILEALEVKDKWNKLRLGDKVLIHYERFNIKVEAVILEINFDFENGDISLTIANVKEILSDEEKLAKLLYNTYSSSTSVALAKEKWNEAEKQLGEINDIINAEWDATQKRIIAGVNESVEIGKRGIIIKNPSFPDEMLIAQSGVLALSKDGGKTWRTAITPSHVVAETVMGKLIAGVNLIIENESGKYRLDENGFTIDGGSLNITNGLPESQIDPDAVKKWNTVDQKRRVFVTQPTPPYDVGDLWANGQTVYRCKTAKTSGQSFSSSDWELIGDVTSQNTSNNTANVGNQPATTVANAVSNFNTRNDRKSTPPANPTIATDGTAIDHTINTDGSADISFEWSFTGTGDAYDIDGFIVYVYQSTSSSPYSFGTSASQEQVFYVTPDKRALILYGVPADRYYTFGVQAYRIVDNDINSSGILKSSIIKSTATGENPYRPSSNVAFTGNVTGTINGQSAATVAAKAIGSLQEGALYNNVKLDSNAGLVAIRSDNKVRTILNATDGIKIQSSSDGGNTWQDKMYADTNGFLRVNGLIIDSSSTINGTSASTVVQNANDGATAKSTIDANKSVWDRASNFRTDGKLDVSKLYGTLSDSQIASAARWNGQGTYIDQNGVYTGIILAKQIIVGNFENLFNDGSFENGSVWLHNDSEIINDPANAQHGNKYLRIAWNGQYNDVYEDNWIYVIPGEKYYIEGYAKASTSKTVRTYIVQFRDKNDTVISHNIGTMALTTSWQKFSNTFTVPANAVKMRLGVSVANSESQSGYYTYFDNLYCKRMIDTSLIVDGAIEAKHIKSLNGLNVNDQFIVDSSGKVKFSTSGTNGSVTIEGDTIKQVLGDENTTFGTFQRAYLTSGKLLVEEIYRDSVTERVNGRTTINQGSIEGINSAGSSFLLTPTFLSISTNNGGYWAGLSIDNGKMVLDATSDVQIKKDIDLTSGVIKMPGSQAVVSGADGLYLYTDYGSGGDSYLKVKDDGAVFIVVDGAVKHSFYASGTKSGGSIIIDGKNLGMSPIDSPQILLEYIEFDIPLTPTGVKVFIEDRFRKAIESFAVFPNNGQVIEKGYDYFVIAGEGIADVRIIGKRIGYLDHFFEDLDSLLESEDISNVS
jgi:phage minor structural protein